MCVCAPLLSTTSIPRYKEYAITTRLRNGVEKFIERDDIREN